MFSLQARRQDALILMGVWWGARTADATRKKTEMRLRPHVGMELFKQNATEKIIKQKPLFEQLWDDHIVGIPGNGEHRDHEEPDATNHDGHMQLPAVPPAMIPEFAQGRFGVT